MYRLPMEQVAHAIERADIEEAIALEKKLNPQFEQDKLSPEKNLGNRRRGILGQQAVRDFFGMPPLEPPWDKLAIWEGRREGDIGTGCEVRSTEWASGQMLLHEPDKDHHGDNEEPWLSRNYVLVVVQWDGEYSIPGWLPMKVAEQNWDDFKKGHFPCMGVKQECLWRISGLMIEENGTSYWSRHVE